MMIRISKFFYGAEETASFVQKKSGTEFPTAVKK